MLRGSKHRWGREIEPEYLGAGGGKLRGRSHLGAGAKDDHLALRQIDVLRVVQVLRQPIQSGLGVP